MPIVPAIDPVDYLEAPKAKRGFRGHAIFFSFMLTLGACVVCSHVYQWKLPVPGRGLDAYPAAQTVDAATIQRDETAAAY